MQRLPEKARTAVLPGRVCAVTAMEFHSNYLTDNGVEVTNRYTIHRP
jgi:hypothetical protein